MKIVILGIDALEYNLVEKWDLKNLKQKAYTKTDLSDFDIIVTPLIWGSMLTGQKLKEMEEIWRKRKKFFSQQRDVRVKQKQYWYARIASKVLPERVKKFLIKKFVPDPFGVTSNYLVNNPKYKTIFDYFERTWNNGIPSYGRNVADQKIKKISEMAADGNPKPLYDYAMNLYRKERAMLLDAVKSDYQLIFWYTPFLDKIEHFYWRKKLKLLNIYMELNRLVDEVKAMLDENDILYIISDHGMKESPSKTISGEHSDHGFFSSNTGELIKKPQQLFDIIVEKARNLR